jgi:hypothetical protein
MPAGRPAGGPALAPIGCAALPGAPAFVFANAAAPEPARLCWYALQQLGFLAGLEPLSHCPDAMSIQEGCGDKTLTDHESECGATFAQPCRCGGGTTRNAHRTMLEAFGRRPEVADVFGRADATSRAPR